MEILEIINSDQKNVYFMQSYANNDIKDFYFKVKLNESF